MRGPDRILIVEDEKLIRMTLHERLRKAGYQVIEAENGRAGIERLREEGADLVLLDYRLPDINGVDVLREGREIQPDATFILMTAFSSVETAVEALKLGAFDYLTKPVNHDALLATIAKALETTRLRREVRRLRDEQQGLYGIANIVGHSRPTQNLLTTIRKVAESSATTVMIQGESGTGKDLAAKAIHYASARADKPFMNITCSALPETLLESELFGHERGAFTDAKQLKKGLLELADGGTVFLDEIGDMPLSLQAKLLRFLEEKAFKRVGGSRDLHVDVRIIGATNKDLERAVRNGEFREDLYYRLKVIPIVLPPLSERRDDVPDLVQHFLIQFGRAFKKPIHGITPEAMALLARYDWPGNIRELKNVVERMVILSSKPELDVIDLPEEIVHAASTAEVEDSDTTDGDAALELPAGGTSLREMERRMVEQALERTQGNQTRAAKLLRISRDTLRYKMKKFGLG